MFILMVLSAILLHQAKANSSVTLCISNCDPNNWILIPIILVSIVVGFWLLVCIVHLKNKCKNRRQNHQAVLVKYVQQPDFGINASSLDPRNLETRIPRISMLYVEN